MPISCDEVIRKALQRNLTDKEVQAFLAFASVVLNRAKATGNPAQAAQQISLAVAHKRLQLLAKKRARLIQTGRRLDNVAMITGNYKGMEWRGVESLQVGTQYAREGSHFSVGALTRATEERYLGGLIMDLKQDKTPGLLDLFRKQGRGEFGRQIARALWSIDDPKKFRGPAEAMAIARHIHKWQERARSDQNKAGASIMKLDGYIVRQSHDQDKIVKAGMQKWVNYMKTALDWTQTADGEFDPATDPKKAEQFLQKTWEALASGIHEKKPGAQGVNNPLTQASYTGKAAAKLNKNRVLHFKDADAWFDYNQQFGRGTINEAVVSGLRHAAGNASLMRIFGPSPQAGFEFLKRDLKAQMKKEKRYKDIEDFRKHEKRLEQNYKVIDGSADLGGNPTLAQAGRMIRSLNNQTKLGGVLLSSITDAPNFASEFAYQGRSFAGSLLRGIYWMIKGRGTADQQRILASCGVFFDSISASLTEHFKGNNLEGKMSFMSNLFFRLNGLSWWTDAWKKAAGLMLSSDLAHHAKNDFQGLHKSMKRLLNIYGIKEEHWNLLRKGKMAAADGRLYLTPEIAQQIDLKDVETLFRAQGKKKFTQGALEQWRDELEERIRTMIRDRVSYAVLEPDARTRSYIYGATTTGTPWGETIRLAMQFKSFPCAFMQRVAGREFYGRDTESMGKGLLRSVMPGKNEEMNNFATIFILMTLFGFASMTAKNLAAGKSPRSPKDPKAWVAAALQGGGLGLYGDFLLGEKSRMGSSFWSTLGGPTGTTLEQVANLWWGAREGDDIRADAFRLAWSNIPGNNLFYVRSAFDYLIAFNFYEHVSPGYFARYKRRVKKENNQTLLFKPYKWF